MSRRRQGRPERIGPLTTSGMRRRGWVGAAAAVTAAVAVWAVAIALVLNPGDVLNRNPPSAAGSGTSTGAAVASPSGVSAPHRAAGPGRHAPARPPGGEADAQPASRFAVAPATGATPVRTRLRGAPRAGLLFDVRTGRVLWQLHPRRRLPIASLTKVMTALLIVERHRPGERVRISQRAAHTPGSGTGVLKPGRRVRLESLLNALLLVSGNDAAVALAQHDAGSTAAFIRRMNRRGRELGLRCTHFNTPNGLRDRGNDSCPVDLATLARADLAEPRIRRIAGADMARFPFPIRGGYLDLYNNNPFVRLGAKDVTGLKTGFTQAAGRCYVITARHRGRELGVVLLNSPDPIRQVTKLLKAGFRTGKESGPGNRARASGAG